jgi:hypothetical protein
MTMERYAHVTAGQQREAADLLEQMLINASESVTESVTQPKDGVGPSGEDDVEVVVPLEGTGSGGRIRTYDQAVNSRPLYH